MAAALGRVWLCRVLRNTDLGPRLSRQAAFPFLKNDWIHSFTRSLASHEGRSSALGKILGVTKQETEDVGGPYPSAVSVSKAEQDYLLLHQPDQPENSRVLRVAIIGAPNAGKSTLSNRLLGRKVFPVSSKVHTTRCRAQGVITDGTTQIVLLDTPGLISAAKAKRHNLEKSLLDDPWHSVKEANLVLVLVDISDHWTRNKLHTELLKCLSKYPHLPAVLVLNKVDLLTNKGLLLELTARLTEGVVNNRKLKIKPRFNSRPQQSTLSRNVSGKNRTGSKGCGDGEAPIETGVWDGEYVGNKKAPSEHSQGDSAFPHAEVSTDCVSGSNDSVQQPADTGGERHQGLAGQHEDSGDSKHREGWPHFKEVFMLSAVNGEEVETLQRYLMSKAQPGSWDYHSAIVTDQSPQEICCNLIRERLLEHLPQEVPYNIIQSTELWEEGPSGELRILQNITVARKNHARLLIGQGGQLIGKIARDVGQDLMNVFLCDVQLKLCVKVKK
ncbi:GTPase Era, mitochondrial [Scyliorhinus canicula]|uniref:GTPase Era, mitochondrial n=1 Tax=Scyliorhinus canicula TaxID=7830 RepID=UPI0018F2A5F1|nr:GTPase Era, mitochondrial [Scyliorhinus canicula]